jgi:hypothetical protein
MESAALRNYLAEVALRGNMEFFAQPDDLTGAVHSTPSTVKPQSALAVASLAQAAEREAAFPRWGINE